MSVLPWVPTILTTSLSLINFISLSFCLVWKFFSNLHPDHDKAVFRYRKIDISVKLV